MLRLIITLPMIMAILMPVTAFSQTTEEIRHPQLKCSGASSVTANGKTLRGEAGNGIYGCCPQSAMAPIATPCESPLDKYDPYNTYVDVVDPSDGVPWRFKSVYPRSTYNTAGAAIGDYSSVAREVGDDQCDETRTACYEKIFDKGDNPCLWRSELVMGAAISSLTSMVRPYSTGRTKLVAGVPDIVCQQVENIVPESDPYRNTVRGTGDEGGDNKRAGEFLADTFRKLTSADGFQNNAYDRNAHTSGLGGDRFFSGADSATGDLPVYAAPDIPGIDKAHAAGRGSPHIYDHVFNQSRYPEHPPGLMSRLFSSNPLSTDTHTRFLAGREWQGRASFGDSLPFSDSFDSSFAKAQYEQIAEDLEKLTLEDIQASRYVRISDPGSPWSPFDRMLLYPIDKHYSPAAGAGAQIGKDHRPYGGVGQNYNSDRETAVRCAGNKEKVIPVNLMDNRYEAFHNQIMKRITFNRLCKADVKAISPPHCKRTLFFNIPCWSRLCWGESISADKPPARTNWDAGSDPAYDKFFNWINLPHVTAYIDVVNSALIDYQTGTLTDRIPKVCERAAEPMPMINNQPLVDIREVAANGQTLAGPEMTFFGTFGVARPYVAMPGTRKEYGQEGDSPDYNSTDGAYVGIGGTTYGGSGYRLASADIPDFGFNDGEVGFVKSLLKGLDAHAAGAGGGTSAGPCIGGVGSRAGEEGCPDSTAHPMFGAMGEQLILQARTKRELGHSCMPHYGRLFYKGAQAMVSDVLSAPVNILVTEDGEKTGIQRTIRHPLSCRGTLYHPDSAQAFPNGGGGEAPEMETGLDSLSDLSSDPDKSAAGAVFILEYGGAFTDGSGGFDADQKPARRNVGVVTQVGDGFIDAMVTNIGLWPDATGFDSGSGQRITRRFYRKGQLPSDIRASYDRMGIPYHCGVAAQSSGACELDDWTWDNTEWTHFNESLNQVSGLTPADETSFSAIPAETEVK
jgi:hypothetical protein